ncbi:hypothetical protein PTSG_10431 [Salpingoeca rosetta]|uniref:DUF202 domain-containing protein n=1 Tax=Salpingoeca rosetta (strain ATCC 50818 / BSB-021) TaxID=946362 RepID=F2UPM7_SALR5|nr:uncharacterized protein PTSG_10431 [Salpingoeca rosetta]EGD79582.1 hypothetical protein PTSG_10431 [Salpingoeca rosetta]|eukprot:XP_004988810.1 hypothetical protein PTSG_10431 [Salpingoeca rosetta]
MQRATSSGSTVVESLRLAHENGFLSWTRNCVITTVAAAAFYNIDPMASSGLFAMSSVFMYAGTFQYWAQARRIHQQTPFTRPALAVIGVVPTTLAACWTLAIFSILDKTPDRVANMVPMVMTRLNRAPASSSAASSSPHSSPHAVAHIGQSTLPSPPPSRKSTSPLLAGVEVDPIRQQQMIVELVAARHQAQRRLDALQHTHDPSSGMSSSSPSSSAARVSRKTDALRSRLEVIDFALRDLGVDPETTRKSEDGSNP